MADLEADTIIILSSELIAEVMEKYFNEEMFKKQVKVVDLKSTETGYMFSIAFNDRQAPVSITEYKQIDHAVNNRDNKGKYRKVTNG